MLVLRNRQSNLVVGPVTGISYYYNQRIVLQSSFKKATTHFIILHSKLSFHSSRFFFSSTADVADRYHSFSSVLSYVSFLDSSKTFFYSPARREKYASSSPSNSNNNACALLSLSASRRRTKKKFFNMLSFYLCFYNAVLRMHGLNAFVPDNSIRLFKNSNVKYALSKYHVWFGPKDRFIRLTSPQRSLYVKNKFFFSTSHFIRLGFSSFRFFISSPEQTLRNWKRRNLAAVVNKRRFKINKTKKNMKNGIKKFIFNSSRSSHSRYLHNKGRKKRRGPMPEWQKSPDKVREARQQKIVNRISSLVSKIFFSDPSYLFLKQQLGKRQEHLIRIFFLSSFFEQSSPPKVVCSVSTATDPVSEKIFFHPFFYRMFFFRSLKNPLQSTVLNVEGENYLSPISTNTSSSLFDLASHSSVSDLSFWAMPEEDFFEWTSDELESDDYCLNANSALLPVSDSAVTASFESSVSLTPNLFFHLDDPALSFLSSLPSSLVCDKSFRVLPTSFLSFKKVIFIRLTSTINNLIVTVTRFDGSTLFVRSVGYEKFFNSQKRSFTSCWQFGLQIGRMLRRIPSYRERYFCFSFRGVLRDRRVRGFFRGFRKTGIRLRFIFFRPLLSYNGCRTAHYARTGRRYKFYF